MRTMLALFLSAFLTLADAAHDPAPQGDTAQPQETVILLHGMGRTRASMYILERRLRKAGYETLNFPYEIRKDTVEDFGRQLQIFIEQKVETPAYHLVGHSLGNIIIRQGFHTPYPPGLKRIVMLAPPNNPAVLAEKLEDNVLYKVFTKDAGRKLASPEFYATLPAPNVQFGIIAGDKGHHIVFKEPNDSVVAIENTKLKGMTDWIVLHHAHSFIMNAEDTAAQTDHFFKHGKFDHPKEEPTPP